MKFFIHVYQQVGYKNREFWQWLKSNWDAKVIPADIAFFNILIFIILYFNDWLYENFTNTSLIIVFFLISFFWFGSVKNYRSGKVKKPLVFTPRVWRFFVPFLLLSLIFPATFTYMAYSGLIPVYQIPLPSYFTGFQNF